jgi:transposase-like protein
MGIEEPIMHRMPIANEADVTCPFCGHTIRTEYVYTFEDRMWRCYSCARKLGRKIRQLRRRWQTLDNAPARQPADIQ